MADRRSTVASGSGIAAPTTPRAESAAAPAAHALALRLLGSFAARVDGQTVLDVAWRLHKAKQLVKLLALAPAYRAHRAAVLDLLWPDLPERQANHNLRTTLYVARQALAAPGGACPFLQMEDDVLSLRGRGTVSTDLDQFEAAATAAARHNALHYWETAADLYTGDLLPDDLYEDWVAARRDSARQHYATTLFGLARRYEVEGRWPEAVATWRRLIAHEPTYEEAHQALMRLHFLAGERRLAIAQFASLRRVLQEHFGIPPDTESERLYREIVASRPSLPASRMLTPDSRRTGIPRIPPLSLRPGAEEARAGRRVTPTVARDIYTWGHNGAGQLGPVREAESSTPQPLRGLTGVVMLAAGEDHSLALRADGMVWSWGSNGYGQLGDGTTRARRVPVRITDVDHVVAIAAGGAFSLALCAEGTVWGWGANHHEQIGGESTHLAVWQRVERTCCLASVRVRTPTGVTAIAAGTVHCLALLGDGTVWGWGQNGSGQLVPGANNDRGVPVQVHALRGVHAIACGASHSLALLGDGTVLAWGANSAWQLGDGTTASRGEPMVVRGLPPAVAIASGGESSFALAEDGALWAWGQNGFGQLGIGSRESQGHPVRVRGLDGATAVTGSLFHTLAIDARGLVWAWGVNTYGQLGDGTRALRSQPVRGGTGEGILCIAAGTFHSLAGASPASAGSLPRS